MTTIATKRIPFGQMLTIFEETQAPFIAISVQLSCIGPAQRTRNANALTANRAAWNAAVETAMVTNGWTTEAFEAECNRRDQLGIETPHKCGG